MMQQLFEMVSHSVTETSSDPPSEERLTSEKESNSCGLTKWDVKENGYNILMLVSTIGTNSLVASSNSSSFLLSTVSL